MVDKEKFYSETLGLNRIKDITNHRLPVRNLLFSFQANREVSDTELFDYIGDLMCLRCVIDVDIPSRGAVNNIDIKTKEPLLLIFNKNTFPYKAPIVYPDRLNFPFDKLPHMNLSKSYKPALCLHRGNIDEWFSEHNVEEFIVRIRSWLRDAASNRLIRDNDQFEPTRIVDEEGFIVYHSDNLVKFIQKYWSENSGNNDYGFYIFKLCFVQDIPSFMEIIKLYKSNEYAKMINDFNGGQRKTDTNLHVGLIIWPKQNCITQRYFGRLPSNINELDAFGRLIGCDIKKPVDFYWRKIVKKIVGIPIICAVNRPSTLIGSNSKIELLNFVVNGEKKDLPTAIFGNRVNITYEFAKNISGIEDRKNPDIILVGLGAMGSKISNHLSRCGYNRQYMIDHDILLPHNIIRHALFYDSVGKNKANAIKEKLNELYVHDDNCKCEASEKSIFEILSDNNTILKDKYSILFDFTASSSVMNCLIDNNNIPRVIRTELGFNGKIGVMLIEGKERSPRLDEIQTMLFFYSNEINEISQWLLFFKNQRDQLSKPEFEEISTGLSCSSYTLKLSDDVISLHSAIFSTKIRRLISNDNATGELLLNYFDPNQEENNYTKSFLIHPFIIKQSACGNWTIKLYKPLYDLIMRELFKYCPKETGGILIGHINIQKRVIYAIDSFTPEDSMRNPYAFSRGVHDVPLNLKKYTEKSGGLINYVGEWHTHPKMGLSKSKKDQETFDLIFNSLNKIGLPTHIAIFNETDFISYVE